MLADISAASIGIVPDPHIKSTNGLCGSQPDNMIIPAASTSLRGALSTSTRYPLRCNESPLLLIKRVHLFLLMNTFTSKSESVLLTSGRLPVSLRKQSAIASLTFKAGYKLLSNKSEFNVQRTENV